MTKSARSVDIRVRRIYERDEERGTHVVLVDRLWPRGVKKSDAHLDEWLREVAPSDGLRRWYGHDPERFAEFARRYRAELRAHPASHHVERLLEGASKEPLVLLTATRDVEHSGARVLRDHLVRKSRSRRAKT